MPRWHGMGHGGVRRAGSPGCTMAHPGAVERSREGYVRDRYSRTLRILLRVMMNWNRNCFVARWLRSRFARVPGTTGESQSGRLSDRLSRSRDSRACLGGAREWREGARRPRAEPARLPRTAAVPDADKYVDARYRGRTPRVTWSARSTLAPPPLPPCAAAHSTYCLTYSSGSVSSPVYATATH